MKLGRFLFLVFIILASVIKTLQAVEPTFDAQKLKQYYNFFASKYSACIYPDCSSIRKNGLTTLGELGIDHLLNEKTNGISAGERVLMLNNYGYWLSGQDAKIGPEPYRYTPKDADGLQKAVMVLKKVIELSPDRSVAWLNLGDTFRALIPLAVTDGEKADLWSEAIKAYSRYKEITGKDAHAAAELAAFDLPKAISSAKDVCDYAANAYNQGKLGNISSSKGTVSVDGKSIIVHIGPDGGTCTSDELFEEGRGAWDTQNEIDLQPLKLPEVGCEAGGGNLLIVPFHGKSYIIGDKPSDFSVFDPNYGSVCDFKPHYTPKLVENKDPELCAQYLADKLDTNAKWSPLKDDEIKSAKDLICLGDANFDKVTDITLDGTKVRIGHFTQSWSGGSGCEASGIALIEKDAMAQNDQNKSLIAYQNKWWLYNADIIQIDGKIYIDTWANDEMGRDNPSSALLQLKNNSIQPICRIEQIATVTPITTAAPTSARH